MFNQDFKRERDFPLSKTWLHTTTNSTRSRKIFDFSVGYKTLILTIWACQWQKQVILRDVHWGSSRVQSGYIVACSAADSSCALPPHWANFKKCIHSSLRHKKFSFNTRNKSVSWSVTAETSGRSSHPFLWLSGVLPAEMRQPSSWFFSA